VRATTQRIQRGVRAQQSAVCASPAVAGFQPAGAALALAVAFAGFPLNVLAQTSGLQAVHGAASISTQGNRTTVTTQNGAGSNHSALNWQSFGVAAGSVTHFNQPGAQSTSINRVLGNNPSAIFGTLSSNGKLVLVNPSGIAVGAGAVVDTAGFTASTLSMQASDAVAGRLRFGQEGVAGQGVLSVNGRVVARSGDVVLVAPHVEVGAQAVVQSPQGATILAAGQVVEVTGRGLEGIRLEVQAPQDEAMNLGALQGDAVGIFAGTLRHSGHINAQAISAEGGKVFLLARSQADISGQVVAANQDKGGQVHATANKVMLRSGAVIDASGASGGGEILVGGGWQGRDSRLRNANETVLESGVILNADANVRGNGGTVVVWSDDVTRTGATLQARGGVLGGNGGQVETSGKTLLDVTSAAAVHARAADGVGGEWLLDPLEIVIGTGAPAVSPPFPFGGANASASSFIAPALVETALNAGGNVTIKTSGPATAPGPNETHIRVAEPITMTGASAATLKLVAHGNVQVDGVTIQSTGGPLNLDFQAGYAFDAAANSTTGGSVFLQSGTTLGSNGGSVLLQANAPSPNTGVHLNSAVINASAGAVSVVANGILDSAIKLENSQISAGSVMFNGNVSAGGDYGISLANSSLITGGAISLSSSDSRIKVVGSNFISGGGNISLSAKGTADASHPHSLALVASAAPTPVQTAIQTTGAGTILLQGQLTGGGVSAPGVSAGVFLDGATVTTGGGALSVVGRSGVAPSPGVTGPTHGVSLKVSSSLGAGAGALSISGETGNSSGPDSVGVALDGTATANSVTVVGTASNPSQSSLTGISVKGTLSAANNLSLNGTVSGQSGKGVDVAAGATVNSGAGGLAIQGSATSGSTSAAVEGISISGAVTSSGPITATGVVSVPVGNTAAIHGLSLMAAGQITATGSGGIALTGSGVPSPAPATQFDLNLAGTTISSAGGEIKLVGDRVNLATSLNSGSGRAMFVPFTASRPIALGGSNETGALNLSNGELSQVSASVIVVGGNIYTGGLSLDGAVNINPARSQSLSLISAGAISQTGALSVNNLNADGGGGVSMMHASNNLGQLSGRAASGDFRVNNAGTSSLNIGQVDGIPGIQNTGAGFVEVVTGGPLVQSQAVIAPTFKSTSTDGLALTHTGNQIGAFEVSNTSEDIVIKNGVATTLTSIANYDAGMPFARYIQIDNAGAVTVGSVTTQSAQTGLTGTTAAVSIRSSGAISALGAGPHISATSGGSVFLSSTVGNVGASPAARLGINTDGPVWVDAVSGAANLGLVGTSAQLKHVSASGAINIAGGGANALTVDNAYSSGNSIQLAGLGSVLVQGNMTAQLGVDIAATNSITVQPSATSSADAQINASGSIKLDVSGTGSINILAGANHGAKLSGAAGGSVPGCATDAVCLTTGGAGTINVTASGNNAARILSPSGNISLTTTGGTLNLSAASAPATGDALVHTGGGLSMAVATCNGCNLLPFGTTPFANGVPQAGVLANNHYRKLIAMPDSGSIAEGGGTIDLLANDSVETANGSPVSAGATPALVTLSLASLPAGVTLLSGTSLDVSAATAPGTYTLGYTSCAVADPNNCATGTVSFTKAGTPAPTPAPTPPAPTPPAPTPPAPAPTPPAPTPPAPPAPTPPAPPAPTPPAPPAPAPTPPAPAPAPSAAPVVDRIVTLLRTDTSRAEIQQIVDEVDNTLTKFVALLIREEASQSDEKKKDEEAGIVADASNQQCN
jgi:filamentous hemagglutinin family protein